MSHFYTVEKLLGVANELYCTTHITEHTFCRSIRDHVYYQIVYKVHSYTVYNCALFYDVCFAFNRTFDFYLFINVSDFNLFVSSFPYAYV